MNINNSKGPNKDHHWTPLTACYCCLGKDFSKPRDWFCEGPPKIFVLDSTNTFNNARCCFTLFMTSKYLVRRCWFCFWSLLTEGSRKTSFERGILFLFGRVLPRLSTSSGVTLGMAWSNLLGWLFLKVHSTNLVRRIFCAFGIFMSTSYVTSQFRAKVKSISFLL